MTTTEREDVYYDPFDAEINANPHPTFRRLRDEAPIYYNERYEVWALSRFDDIERALVDWQTFSSAKGDILEVIKADIDLPSGVVMFEDPRVHTLHRGLLSRVFTPKRMNALEDQVRRFCIACLDPIVGSDRFDFVVDLGAELPMRVIGMLLGIPDSDQPAIRDRADAILRTEEGMIRRLTRAEVLTYVDVLAGAGNETTGRLIGWLGKVLGDHPDQRRLIVEDRSLIPNAVDETLRYEPTGLHLARYVTGDVDYHGTTVPAGSAILLLVGSANRDERHHVDPDRYDVRREVGALLTFGHGLHYCLGAALARLEGRVALEEVLNRWSDWEVDMDEARLSTTSTVRGWDRMPVQLGRSAPR
jgi:cytochrome P450